eukprot:501137-Pleurochrysis_carterae.AAC.1
MKAAFAMRSVHTKHLRALGVHARASMIQGNRQRVPCLIGRLFNIHGRAQELALSNGVIEQASGDDTEPVPHTVRTQQVLGCLACAACVGTQIRHARAEVQFGAGCVIFLADQRADQNFDLAKEA